MWGCRPAAAPPEAREADDPGFVDAKPAAADRTPVESAAPEIRWETSLAAALRRAKSEHRAVLVWARADWATAAVQSERVLWPSPSIRRAVRPFVALQLDFTVIGADADERMSTLSLRQIPALLALDENGRELGRLEGIVTPEQALKLIAEAEKR